jgi:NADPH-dependent 7-cyano-7-deazaguanine reductase QueF-like protein
MGCQENDILVSVFLGKWTFYTDAMDMSLLLGIGKKMNQRNGKNLK